MRVRGGAWSRRGRSQLLRAPGAWCLGSCFSYYLHLAFDRVAFWSFKGLLGAPVTVTPEVRPARGSGRGTADGPDDSGRGEWESGPDCSGTQGSQLRRPDPLRPPTLTEGRPGVLGQVVEGSRACRDAEVTEVVGSLLVGPHAGPQDVPVPRPTGYSPAPLGRETGPV